MENVPVRRLKIDRNFIDLAFANVPKYQSFDVSPDKEQHFLRLINDNHDDSLSPYKPSQNNPLANVSISSVESMYLASPTKLESIENSPTEKSPNRKSPTKQPHSIIFEAPFEDDAKHLNLFMPSETTDLATSENVLPTETSSHNEESPLLVFDHSRSEIEEFKKPEAMMTPKLMRMLVEDLQKKEEKFFNINRILRNPQKKTYPRKKFLVIDSQINLIMSSNDGISPYDLINQAIKEQVQFLKQDNEEVRIYLVMLKIKVWEMIKIKLSKRNTLFFYEVRSINPCYGMGYLTGPSYIEKAIEENILKQLFSLNFNPTKLEKPLKNEQIGVSSTLADSGIEIFKRMASGYSKLSKEKINREYIYFWLLEKYFGSQSTIYNSIQVVYREYQCRVQIS